MPISSTNPIKNASPVVIIPYISRSSLKDTNWYSTSVLIKEKTPPTKNIFKTSKKLILRNALDSKKNITPEIGTISAPINIIPGILFSLPNIFAKNHKPIKVINSDMNTRENTHGFPHSSETSVICGVVLCVPAINTSSDSCFEWNLNTWENISLKFNLRISSFPANLPIDFVVLLNRFLASSVILVLLATSLSICWWLWL